MPSSSSSSSSCPCCSFLPEDLFLPQAEEEESRRTTLEAAGKAQDGNNEDDGVDCTLPDLMTVLNELELQSQQDEEKAGNDDNHDSLSATRVYIRLVDTHGHAHLEERVEQDDKDNDDNNEKNNSIYQLPDNNKNIHYPEASSLSFPFSTQFLSVSCAVEPADWAACIAYASQSPRRVAALGVHPWYVANLEKHQQQQPQPQEQKSANKTPEESSAKDNVNPDIVNDDDDWWLVELERHLQQHPGIMVGEIGLCKVAKWIRTYEHGKTAALAWQRRVFCQQLQLAAQYQRPVTIHCVHQQQILLDALKELTVATAGDKNSLPPAMALHSFTGTAHHVDQLLKWEASVMPKKQKKNRNKNKGRQNKNVYSTDKNNSTISTTAKDGEESSSSSPPLLYFGFSHIVNYVMCSSTKSRQQGRAAIRAVPSNRLLAESDVHASADAWGGTALAVAYLAWALEEPVDVVAQRTTTNALRFLQTLRLNHHHNNEHIDGGSTKKATES